MISWIFFTVKHPRIAKYRPDLPVIVGRLKEEKIPEWSAATENRIGKRIGFVYNESVIMAPTVSSRLESGTFTIESQDSGLIWENYKSLEKSNQEKKFFDLIC